MKLRIVIAFLALGTSTAFAQEPAGCGKFKWPIAKERALLSASNIPAVPSGDSMSGAPETAVSLALTPAAEARLPMSPERTPRDPSTFAGYVRLAGMKRPGNYRINLSAEAWINVLWNGQYLKSGAHSGVTDCDGIRKSVNFELPETPFVIQLSGARSDPIRMVITSATE